MNIKQKIKNSGYTKQFLAERIGVSASYFSRYLNSTAGLRPEKEKLLKSILDKSLIEKVA